jgi:hypothetical protein
MKSISRLAILLLVRSVYAQSDGDLVILIAEPLETESAEFYYNVCGDDNNCLAHGYDGIYVTINVTEVIYGEYPTGRSIVAATDGFLRHKTEPLGNNSHLFLLRNASASGMERAEFRAVEADPIHVTACTVFPIEDYISGEVFMSLDAAFVVDAEYCYTLQEIRVLANEH